MLAKIYTATLIGLEAKIIEVEVDVSRGERNINIVGLPDTAVKESKERILSAFRNSSVTLGPGRKIVNLAPADIPKSGPSYDLPIAVGLLVSRGIMSIDDTKDKLFLGELSLDGRVRPVGGVLAIVEAASKIGFREFFVPYQNAKEAGIVKNIRVFPVKRFDQVLEHFKGNLIDEFRYKSEIPTNEKVCRYDLLHVRGQIQARRALEIAAAGGHNLLLSGVPGSGKTFIAKCLPSILPKLSFEESVEVTRIYSVAGLTDPNFPLIRNRPFRTPHHTSSQVSIVGGGTNPRPGEVSLAHRGVLFLDEFPEFERRTLEVLRQPIEDRVVTISRARATVQYPADFQIVAAMNPCQCGYLGDPKKECICTEFQRQQYNKKISGPILDRIDLRVSVYKVNFDEIHSSVLSESSSDVASRVQNARQVQASRYKNFGIVANSQMSNENVKKFVDLDASSKALLKRAVDEFDLSMRGYFRVLKVARTIADLSCANVVCSAHVAEALSYRIN